MGHLEPLEPVSGRRRFRLNNPRDGAEVGTFTVHTADDVAQAITRARAAQVGWDAMGADKRAKLLLRAVDVILANKDRYIDLMTKETGRPVLDTLMIEMFAGLDSLNFYSRNAARLLKDRWVPMHLLRHKKMKMTWRPLGVVGVISPWNGPFILSMNPTVQALLGGNTVIVKPSEATPFSGMLVEEIFRDAGLPDGVVQVLTGDGETGAALVEGGVDKITFTGSVRTGRKVGEACARQLIPCCLELGGKDPMVVCADADIDRAVGGAAFGGLMNNGQFCSGVERIYVVDAVYDRFVGKLVDLVGKLEKDRDIGPFIFEPQADVVERHVTEALAAGAKALVGGARDGNYFQPTVLVDVTHEMAIMTEETFGPVLPVVRCADEDEAIRLANDTVYGLSASVWTKDMRKADRIARRLKAGSITVNESSMVYGALEVPFGGVGDSGVGSTNGKGAILNYCKATPILYDRFGQTEESVWFPYTADKVEQMMKALPVMWGTPLRHLLK